MISAILTFSAFLSAAIFPWPLTALLAFLAAAFEPLAPLAVGIFADTLYYSPATMTLPLGTLGGAVLAAAAMFVRSRLKTGSMGR